MAPFVFRDIIRANMKSKKVLAATALLVVVLGIFVMQKISQDRVVIEPPIGIAIPPKEWWQTYQNKKYTYSIHYPSSLVSISTSNDYGWNDLANQKDISFGVSGKTTLVGIEVEDNQPASTTLKTYAENIRMRQVNDTHSATIAKVGEMREVLVAGNIGYAFTLTGGFNTPSGGYTLGDGETYTYLIIQNSVRQKIVIHYLIDSETYPEGIRVAKDMIDSVYFK